MLPEFRFVYWKCRVISDLKLAIQIVLGCKDKYQFHDVYW